VNNSTKQKFFYRAICAIFIGLYCSVLVFGQPNALSQDRYLRRANYYLRWDISDSQAQQLAKWDLLILDMETQLTSASQLKKIRQLNPNIKILAYITSQEIRSDASSGPGVMRRKLASGIGEQWYLRNLADAKMSYWPGTYMLNITDACPRVNGLVYGDYLAKFVYNEILSTGLWDGIFYDNVWENVSWFTGNNADINYDGQTDNTSAIDLSWQTGMKKMLAETRRLAGYSYLIVGNGINNVYREQLNGIMLESFGSNHLSWTDNMKVYSYHEDGGQTPKAIIINANSRNTGAQNDYRAMRYGLTSALLGDAYYSFDYGDQDHAQTWWYDEYNVNLGASVSTAISATNQPTFKNDVWRRSYDNGLVLVNSTNQTQLINLGAEYEKIKGSQDKTINDGSVVSLVNLPAQDGLVLLKSLQGTGPSQVVNDLVFTNGDFLQFFDTKGNHARNGFFVFDDDYPGGTVIFSGDLDGQTDKNEKITVENNYRIEIFDNAGGRLYHDYPFQFNTGGRVNLTVGSLFGDPDHEIMFTSSLGGKIMVANYYGMIMQYGFYPFGVNNKTAFSPAIGNFDGGQKWETALGFINANKAEVMIYDFRFTKLLSRFTVGYGAKQIFTASGDIDGDGRDEILLALDYGAKTEIKVFNNSAKQLASFSVATGFGGTLSGLGALDVTYDGKKEIVLMTR